MGLGRAARPTPQLPSGYLRSDDLEGLPVVSRHDARIDLDGRRSQADPAFARLRAQLLSELGVEDDHDAPGRPARTHLDERAAS